VGEAVVAPWWDSALTEKRRRSGSNVDGWFPGIVSSYKEIDIDSQYGPIRYYDVLFDDGDEEKELEDYWVWSKEDYHLDTQDDGRKIWIGVRNEVDSKAADKWARITGWWVAKIERKDQLFSRLSGEKTFEKIRRRSLRSQEILIIHGTRTIHVIGPTLYQSAEALDAYDRYTIQLMGDSIKPRDLNRPDKWNLFRGLGQSKDDDSDDATPE
jgi:hypothetical protein